MPPNTGNRQAGPTPEQALASLLSSEQLTELAVLISSITEGMRKKITDGFDASTDSNTIRPRERLQRDAKNPNIDPRTSSSHEESEAEAPARRLQARRERELPEPKLQDLKNDVVEYFQTWRVAIVSKIVDALHTKDTEGRQGEEVTGSSPDATPPPDYKVLGMSKLHKSTSKTSLYFNLYIRE
jgi:hypothetical protein